MHVYKKMKSEKKTQSDNEQNQKKVWKQNETRKNKKLKLT